MRSIIVTGGFGVLGRAVAQAFRDGGDRVARVDFAASAADENPGGLDIGGIDLTDADAAAAVVDQVRAAHGGIDVLVNVAGGFVWEPLADGGPETWSRMFAMNAVTCANMTRAALPVLRGTAGAAIVNIGAGSALVAGAGMGAYAASKAAVHKLTESLAAELAGTDHRQCRTAKHHRYAHQPRRYARCRCFGMGAACVFGKSYRVSGKRGGAHHFGRADPGFARRVIRAPVWELCWSGAWANVPQLELRMP